MYSPIRHLSVLLVTLFLALQASAAEIGKFAGAWEIDQERTIAEAPKSPKFKPADAASLPATVTRMAGMLKLRISDKEVTFQQGPRETRLPYTLESATDSSAVLVIKQGEKEVKLTLTLTDAKTLMLKSTGTDDMDYLVWKRAE